MRAEKRSICFRHRCLTPVSYTHLVYLAKEKLIKTINNGTWPIAIGSDEFYGLWMHYTRFEAAYNGAAHLVAQLVGTAITIGTTIYQTVVTAKSIGMYVKPVSYTHLDVYKRQILGVSLLFARFLEPGAEIKCYSHGRSPPVTL